MYWFCHISTWICHGCTHVPNPEPPPTSFPIPSLWVIPVHQPQASCILHQTWTGDSFPIWYYTCFNAILKIIPPPSPTESKRLFYTSSVSLLLSRIQGYRYHLSKFHIYVLVYCTGVWPWCMWKLSSLTRHHVPHIGRWSLNHWTTRDGLHRISAFLLLLPYHYTFF